MTPLESKLTELLSECESLLIPYAMATQKWHAVSESEKRVIDVPDERGAIAISYGKAHRKISTLKSFVNASNAFERDRVFSDGVRAAGYWASFEGVFQNILSHSSSVKKNKVTIDVNGAIEHFRRIRKVLTQKSVKFVASARLLGANLTAKKFLLPDDIELHKLSLRERNQRQPNIQPYFSNGSGHELSSHPVEIRVPICVPVDLKAENAFFKAKNDAYRLALGYFSKVEEAVLVANAGRVAIAEMTLTGDLDFMDSGSYVHEGKQVHVNVKLGKSDIERVCAAYELVSGGKVGDKTLSRSLHRFVLGRKRIDVVDKIVDYVIAWESMLLTHDGSPVTQELSYRFSVNGASLVASACKSNSQLDVYKKFKGAYSARSTIVHGGSEKEIEKSLATGDYKTISELSAYLEINYRDVLFWLMTLKAKSRPYLCQNGWEKLLWK